MKASPSNMRFITVLFGPLGDALMALALFDDIQRAAPDATLLILTRRNAGMMSTLATEYPQVSVAEIPRGLGVLPFFARIILRPGWTLLTLGLVSIGYSLPLRLFFLCMRLIPGNRTVGFHDPVLQVALDFDIKLLMINNLRRLLPYVLPQWRACDEAPRLRIRKDKPAAFPYAKGAYIVAHLFGVSIPHTLPPHRWRSIFAHLRAHYPGYEIVLTGTPSQRSAAQEVAEGLDGASIRTDLSMHELAYLIDSAALYIGIDTGVTHLAGLLQQKSLVIRHCADPTWVPTYNPHARILLNSSRCTPQDPMLCALISEGGREYRRSTYDISDRLILESAALALSSDARQVPGFAGLIDEKGSA
ncbi:MAG: waaC [Candidatus Adlerbacteria bacterium]|nr:waaC [Candidatus Adlerbacteria bacterium]